MNEQELENKVVYMVISSDDVSDGDRIYPTRQMADARVEALKRAHPGATAIIRELTLGELYNELPDIE